jgi:hypothetical protein
VGWSPRRPLAPRASLRVPDGVQFACEVKPGRMFRVHTPAWGEVWAPLVHAPCVHNEVAALELRMLAPLVEVPLGACVRRSFARIRTLASRYPGKKLSPHVVVEAYSGPLRTRYERARDLLLEGGRPSPFDAKISAFVKREKVSPGGKVWKPRLICGRAPVFNLALACYLKPLEEWLWGRLRSRREWGVPQSRVVGKGLSPERRAALIVRKWEQFQDPAAFEVDAKSFESHVAADQLAPEHGSYLAAYGGDPALARLLSWQRVNSGRTNSGVKFKRVAGRASGDFNTGLGNTLVFLAVISGVLEELLVPRRVAFDLLVDGDNAVVFVDRRALDFLRAALPHQVFVSSGHEVEMGACASRVEQVEFGQSRPVQTVRGWTMVRNPRKVLSHAFCSPYHYGELSYGARVAASVTQCELALNNGVPLLQAYFAAWARCLKDVVPENHRVFEWWHRYARVHRHPVGVTLEARLSFEAAWGVDPSEQRRLEETLVKGLSFPTCWPEPVEEAPFADPDLGLLSRSLGA